MAFNKYYQDELSYLREMGALFSQQNPGLSRYLSEAGSDPDVERLFEGFAFLTGRIRQKLDDELPEVTHSLINLLWPHYLRPLPAMSILEFKPIANALTEGRRIDRGAEVQSVEVEGTSCRFRTCYDVDIYPMEIDGVDVESQSDGSTLTVGFQVDSAATTESWGLNTLKLFLHSDRDVHISQALYLWLFRYLEMVEIRVKIRGSSPQHVYSLPATALKANGFDEREELLPYGNRSFRGYRYLQEYFSLPEKYLFVELEQLDSILNQEMIERFDVCFRFNRRFDSQLRVKQEHIRLFCTPIINLFSAECDPIRIDPARLEYPVRPTYRHQEHIELYSMDAVFGQQRGRSAPITYPAYESFEHELRGNSGAEQPQVFYKLRRSLSTLQSGLDTAISFVDISGEKSVPVSETVSIDLTCTNRRLPETLRAGDVIYPTANSPEFVTFKNISRITPSLPPPMQEGLQWQLIAQMSLHYRAMSKVESLRTILKSYDFRAFYDRQAERSNKQLLEAIHSIKTDAVDRLNRGTPVRCLRTSLELWESKFGAKGIQGESSMFLFAAVLNGYFAQYADINSYHELEVKGLENGEIYQWKIQAGQRPLL